MNSIAEVKCYFDQFHCHPLSESDNASADVCSFSSDIRNNTLETYLKKEAISDDQAGKTRVYVIQEPETCKTVCFFSIRCGAVYATHEEDDFIRNLDTEKLRLLRILEDVRNEDSDAYAQICIQYRKQYSNAEWVNQLIRAVEYRANQRKDKTADGCISVENAHSAIEIQHFCRCDDYQMPKEFRDLGFPLGFGLFWQIIVPKIKKVAALIGCEYLFLFAADKSDDDELHLVNHYKNAMGFCMADELGLTLARPDDDSKCYGLVQQIALLDNSYDEAWNARSDILSDWE